MNPTQQFNYNQQEFTNDPQYNQQYTNNSSIMEMQNYNVALGQQGAYPPPNQNLQMQNYQMPQQLMVQLPAVFQQMINQLTKQVNPAMNFPPELPCNKPDPFKLRNNPMQIEHLYPGRHGMYNIRLSDEQFYKIELLRIKMLNHIAQCSNPQCESVYAAHIDDGQIQFNRYQANKNTLPVGTTKQPAPTLIRLGYDRGLHCAPMPTYSYCLLLIPSFWPIFIYNSCQNYDISECKEAIILNNESMDLQIDANPSYQCQHSCCCKYTGQRK